jgi:cytochrome P450
MSRFARIRGRIGALVKRRIDASALDAATIDLNAPEIGRHPFPYYDALRASGPVQFLARHDAWVVLGHHEAHWAFTRPDLFSSRPYESVDAVLLAADPPEHTVIRRIVSPYFSRDAIEQLAAFAAERAARLLGGQVDIVAGYGRPLSEAVAARLLGFEDAAVEVIRTATRRASTFVDLLRELDTVAHQARIYESLRGDGLEDARARSLVRLFWVASTATSERVIAQCVLALLQHPAERTAVQSNPALLMPFIAEVMRLHPPEPMLLRRTTCDVDLGGAHIPAASQVLLCLAAANRDPRHYQRPSELQLERTETRLLSFGHGIHHCIGVTLGRLAVAAAVRTLLTLAPRFRAAQSLDSVRYCATMMARYIESLALDAGLDSPDNTDDTRRLAFRR